MLKKKHLVVQTHKLHCCQFVLPRLFGSIGGLIDPGYAPELLRQCPGKDPATEFRFDSGLFAAVNANRADGEAARIVDELRDQGNFLAAFARSVRRMGAVGLLTGNDGEIRRNCGVVN
ncbi:hypothetical protein EJB05_10847, partial [Eragrostis curvula]